MIIICCSCGGVGNNYNDALNGQSFDFFERYDTLDNTYNIYLPTNAKQSLLYFYKESKLTSTAEVWTINYIYENNFIIDDEVKESTEVWDGLYNTLLNCKNQIDEMLGFQTTINENKFKEEREVTLQNINQEEISFVDVYSYLPVRINNENNSNTFTVLIPISNTILLKKDGTIKDMYEDKMITWDEFLKTYEAKERI